MWSGPDTENEYDWVWNAVRVLDCGVARGEKTRVIVFWVQGAIL